MRFVPFALPERAFVARLEEMRFRLHKWDLFVKGRRTVERGAVVLEAREHREVVALTERLYALADHAAARFAREPEADPALGLPPALARLARRDVGRPRVTRIDVFPTSQGWRVSEFNDDAPGGYNDAIGLAALFGGAAEKGLEVPGDLPDALLRLVAPEEGAVGLAYATGYAEDLQVVRLVADLLAADGRETVTGSPAELEHRGGRVFFAGREVRTIFRFYPGEWFPLLPNLPAWETAIAAGIPIVNPFSTAWTQSKAVFGFLDDPALPATRRLDASSRAFAVREQHRLVLKPVFGRMGEGVVVGDRVPPDVWEKHLDAALALRQPHILQDRFRATPIEVAPGDTRTLCLGVYVVDGRFAGYYSRLSERPVVGYDATNVLTLVESV